MQKLESPKAEERQSQRIHMRMRFQVHSEKADNILAFTQK